MSLWGEEGKRNKRTRTWKTHVPTYRESISSRWQAVGGPGHTALESPTALCVQIPALKVQIRSFGTQQAGEYLGAEASHLHYDNLAFATTWQSPLLHAAWGMWVGRSSQHFFAWRWLPQHECTYWKPWQLVPRLCLPTARFTFPISLTQS